MPACSPCKRRKREFIEHGDKCKRRNPCPHLRRAIEAAEILGHADPSTTLRLYARDARDEAALVFGVLARAAASG